MTLIADTGGLYALYDADDRHHAAVRRVVEGHPGPIVVPLPVLAELDYFLTRYLGQAASLDFLDSVASGAFTLDHLVAEDIARSRALLDRYKDLELGFVDASVIALAERLRTREILTIDERDFRAVARHRHGLLVLHPADSSVRP